MLFSNIKVSYRTYYTRCKGDYEIQVICGRYCAEIRGDACGLAGRCTVSSAIRSIVSEVEMLLDALGAAKCAWQQASKKDIDRLVAEAMKDGEPLKKKRKQQSDAGGAHKKRQRVVSAPMIDDSIGNN